MFIKYRKFQSFRFNMLSLAPSNYKILVKTKAHYILKIKSSSPCHYYVMYHKLCSPGANLSYYVLPWKPYIFT